MTADLIEWLRVQLDTDERDAPEVHAAWCLGIESSGGLYSVSLESCSCRRPARIQAEVESKRLLLNEHKQYISAKDVPGVGDMPTCRRCGSFGACTTVKALALPYRDREGYRAEWDS